MTLLPTKKPEFKTMKFSPKSLRTAAVLFLGAAALAACGAPTGQDLSQVRSGPQATHPSGTAAPSTRRSRLPQNKLTRAQANAQANAIFDKFCLSGRSNRGIETALKGSGQFKPVIANSLGKARYSVYQLASGTRGGVILVYNSSSGIRCSVGVEGIGPNLYSDGRVVRAKI